MVMTIFAIDVMKIVILAECTIVITPIVINVRLDTITIMENVSKNAPISKKMGIVQIIVMVM